MLPKYHTDDYKISKVKSQSHHAKQKDKSRAWKKQNLSINNKYSQFPSWKGPPKI